jgi:hypothetical protein
MSISTCPSLHLPFKKSFNQYFTGELSALEKIIAILGARKSKSNSATLKPLLAKTHAKLVAITVFPVPPRDECIEIVFIFHPPI